MNIEFEDEDLEDLVYRGKSSNKLYKKISRTPKVMADLSHVMNTLQNAKNVDELFNFRRLNFERLTGNLRGFSSLRVGYSSKYRMLLIEQDEGVKVTVIEINEHYGD